MMAAHSAFAAIIHRDYPSAGFIALTGRINEDAGPLDPVDLAKVFKVLIPPMEDDPNGSRESIVLSS